MKKMNLLVSFTILVLAMGCASNPKYLSKGSFVEPEKAVSIAHPVEIEKAKIIAITKFVAIMDPALWTEIIYGGGVWPVLAQANGEKISHGYGFLTGINFFGDFLVEFILSGTETELRGSKIIYLNRDKGWAYTLLGQEIEGYDSAKFDKNEKFRKKIFDKGTSLTELENFWKEYSNKKGVFLDKKNVQEIIIGSNEWQEYKKDIAIKMKYNYKMPSGQIRCGYLPLEKYKEIAVEMPGFTYTERWLKKAKLPWISLPFTGAGLLIMAGTSIVSDIITAGVNDSWSGYYARATVIRYQMAPLFRQISEIYQKLLEIRDERIKNLELELYLGDSKERIEFIN